MYDVIIIGGGCSGLALAYALCDRQQPLNVLILDARTSYTHDKTWCFFSNTPSPWTHLAKKSWDGWSYHHNNSDCTITHTSKTWRYYYLPSECYYEHTLARINRSSHVTLKLGQSVTSVDRASETVFTNDASYQATYIVDTRPPTHPPHILSQVFYGVYIPQHHNFSTDYVSLMHHMRSDTCGFRFNYVLPVDDNTMLFEHTRFSTTPYSKSHMQSECYSELKRLSIPYTTQYKDEYGVLPMGYNGLSTLTNGGLRAGLLRQSTGYGFLRIQAWAQSLALSLTQQPSTKQRFSLINWMDKLFLQTLRADMTKCPQYFMTLAKRCPADTLVRFLSDQATTYDCVRVMLSLPPGSFVHTLATKSRSL